MGLERVAIEKGMFSSEGLPVSASGMMEHAVSIDTLFNNILNGEQAIGRVLFTDATTLTINVSGTLPVPTLAQHLVSAFSGTSDSLDSITAVNNTTVLLKATAGHTITIRHGVGNIWSMSGGNVILTGNRVVMAVCNGGQWALLAGTRPLANVTTVDPRGSDDRLDGYSNGSIWINTARNRAWMCYDASTAGAAVWGLISPPLNEWSVRAANNTVVGSGCGPTTTGAGSFAASPDADNVWLGMSAAGAGTDCQIRGTSSPQAETRITYNPVIETLVKTGSDVTSQRLWVVMINNPVGMADADGLTSAYIGWRYSTVAGDAGWRPATYDGSTQGLGTAIGAVAANTVYRLRIRVVSEGTVTLYYSVNDSAEQAVTANLPAIATDLRPITALFAQAAGSRTLLFGRQMVWW